MGILYIGAIAGTQVKAFDGSDTQAWEASAVPSRSESAIVIFEDDRARPVGRRTPTNGLEIGSTTPKLLHLETPENKRV
jgi:hypothetical protein